MKLKQVLQNETTPGSKTIIAKKNMGKKQNFDLQLFEFMLLAWTIYLFTSNFSELNIV